MPNKVTKSTQKVYQKKVINDPTNFVAQDALQEISEKSIQLNQSSLEVSKENISQEEAYVNFISSPESLATEATIDARSHVSPTFECTRIQYSSGENPLRRTTDRGNILGHSRP